MKQQPDGDCVHDRNALRCASALQGIPAYGKDLAPTGVEGYMAVERLMANIL
jgi:hypothetical protein